MISSEVYSQVKRLEIETGRIINSTFAGEYQSAFKGRGMEFEEVRPYIEGDEIRFIDWNVTAKLNEPYVKVFREERELQIYLLVDISSSLFFGSTKETKKELLLKISALLSLVSMNNNDRVGLIIFTDRVEKVIPPRKGRKHVLRLISELLTFDPVPRRTDLNAALEMLNTFAKKSSIVFLLSDFQCDGYQKAFEIAAKKHDMVPILIKDRLERLFSGSGFIRVRDLETREEIIINAKDKKFQDKFYVEHRRFYDGLRKYFIKHNTDIIELDTGEPYLYKIAEYFRRKTRRRTC